MADGRQQAASGGTWDFIVSAYEYWVDASQRSLLFTDVMRQRANQYHEHMAETVPHVLNYSCEMLMDGRTLPRPVNYLLVRIIPPEGVAIDMQRRPFVVVDPRAGHGPGIGGFKADSEIGVAMKAGHPCYFIGFTPDPVPGQTILDIAGAQAAFLKKVISLHPMADGKPCVIGNCQAGWAVMILASLRPELFGPIIVAGAPLSYWAGVRGKYPMRYSGGLLGGSWLTALTSDMGGGIFDGGKLVANFENQNPANTFWTKQYNVYSKIDTETQRYLEFERWWGGHVNLNAEEIQFIVDELFIGNNLAAGRIETDDGSVIDLRNIRSPILVFCSKGDNITPPQQALDWILDLYDDVDEIRSFGQTIVYTVHDTIGHLGIFVSGGIAKKEHSEFSSNIDLIDLLPPGLYEAKFERKTEATARSELATGDWVMRCEKRTLDDIRAMGCNAPEDERRFATAARVSEINLALYRAFAQPLVKALVTPQVSQMMRHWDLGRLQYDTFSDMNPAMLKIAQLADQVRSHRKPAVSSNPFIRGQEAVSAQIVKSLEAWQETVEKFSEQLFLATYGSPILQAAVGVKSDAGKPRRPGKSPIHRELREKRIAELKSRIDQGGLFECAVRGLLYAGEPRGAVDERGVEALRQIRTSETGARLSLAQFKATAREQFFLLLLEPEATLAAIPALLPTNPAERRKGFDAICHVLGAIGKIEGETEQRLKKVAQLFGVEGSETSKRDGLPFVPQPGKGGDAKQRSKGH
jgi:pimeloyl-ACP methyl ester carboxylesterase